MNESNQIIELLNNENTTFKNISYKSVNRTKLNNTNNNSFSNNRIRFNTKEISNHLVSYEDAYILLEVDLKFAEEASALPGSIRLKNSYEMINSIKIELNRTIISNEDYVYYSNMIPHLLENSKSDNLLYRAIDLHGDVAFKTNTNKNIFITNAGDIVTVKVPIYLKDISDYFRQLTFPLEFCEYNISIQVVDEIYYKAAAMNIESQTIKSAYLFTDVCYLDEKTNLGYLKNINKFNKTIPIFDNNVVINNDKIAANNFTIHVNNVYNCKNMYWVLYFKMDVHYKDDVLIKTFSKQMTSNGFIFKNLVTFAIDNMFKLNKQSDRLIFKLYLHKVNTSHKDEVTITLSNTLEENYCNIIWYSNQ